MTFDIGLHEVCVRGGRAGVRYAITKFSQLDSLPNFLTHGAPLLNFFLQKCGAYLRAALKTIVIPLSTVFTRISAAELI